MALNEATSFDLLLLLLLLVEERVTCYHSFVPNGPMPSFEVLKLRGMKEPRSQTLIPFISTAVMV